MRSSSTVRSSTARHALANSVRPGAVSPAESTMSSMTAGTKRKERDFETDGAGGEETNINVVVRCRGRNARERKEDSEVVVSTDGVKGTTIDLFMGANALSNKSYAFDRVFSGAADQSLLFDDTVKPMLEEMLKGYNCTIFAYGQTGTGKTYTMSGDMEETAGMLSDEAGIIPRLLEQLFNKLEISEEQHAIKCSFIELYNEELRDLLSVDESAKLKIFDDVSRRGHAGTIVQGMEEKYIHNAAEGIKVLQDGSLKRQVAATKCNDLSSRSHTVFTVTTYVKKINDQGGEELISAGKLNLVDLAGSENIQRSGAENKRAAEAGLINKSLLTLGRVITKLVDRDQHIPYRESKLTRLLQDSLGGRTKTCIIATISPARASLEETISTLDYAFRAKNIKNRPQLNAALSKKTMIEEWTREIEKLKSQLITARTRDGVHLSMESYEEMTAQSESRRIVLEEQTAKIETLETNLRSKVQELFSLTSTFAGMKKDHEGTRAQLDETKEVLEQTEIVLSATREAFAQETKLRKAHEQTEEELAGINKKLKNTIHKTTHDVDGLFKKNKRKSDLQSINRAVWTTSQTQVADVTSMIERRLQDIGEDQGELIASLLTALETFKGDGLKQLAASKTFIEGHQSTFDASKSQLLNGEVNSVTEMEELLAGLSEVKDTVKDRVGERLQEISQVTEAKGSEVTNAMTDLQSQLHGSFSSTGKELKTMFEKVLKENSTLKTENDDLRRRLENALDEAAQQQAAFSKWMTESSSTRERERQERRQRLIALLEEEDKADLARDTELTSSGVSKITELTKTLEEAATQYKGDMDSWDEKAANALEELKATRDGLKTKVKDDWTGVNERCTSLLSTARSHNAEVVRSIQQHANDLEPQMEALDDFATRAKSENANHHAARAELIETMSDVVEQSYASTTSHFKAELDRVRDFGEKMESELNDLRDGLDPLDTQVRQPLANLREEIIGTGLQEYQPTGETPQKTQYSYPTHLPRTRAGSRSSQRISSIAESTTPSESPRSSSLLNPATLIFSDNDMDSKTMPIPSSPSMHFSDRTNHTITSLREINPNTTTFDTHANTISIPTAPSSLPQSTTEGGNTLPIFKRSTRAVRGAGTAPTGLKRPAALAGGENVVPLSSVFEQSMSKRKSPRLN
ncbi:kinesin-domain-containing protein [Sarocladium strictum]